VGYGLGGRLERLRGVLGGLEHWLLIVGLIGTAAVLLWRLVRAARRG
jgi:hypothetical protein